LGYDREHKVQEYVSPIYKFGFCELLIALLMHSDDVTT